MILYVDLTFKWNNCPYMCGSREEDYWKFGIFFNCITGLAYGTPAVVEAWISQFWFLLPKRCFTLKMLTFGFVVFKEVQNKILLTHDGRRTAPNTRRRTKTDCNRSTHMTLNASQKVCFSMRAMSTIVRKKVRLALSHCKYFVIIHVDKYPAKENQVNAYM